MKVSDDMKVASPTTGCTIHQYVLTAIKESGLDKYEFAKAIGAQYEKVNRWKKGINTPNVEALRAIESASNVMLEDYLPEINRGMELLRTIPKWKKGYRWRTMRQHGVSITYERYIDMLKGVVTEERMRARLPISLCKYYDYYIGHQEEFADEDDSLDMKAADEDEKTAYSVYCKLTGKSSKADFGFHKAKDKLWVCDFGTFYCAEIDLGRCEVRIFWKRTGDLSFKRSLKQVCA